MVECKTIMQLVKELVDNNPNDQDLGEKIRNLIDNNKKDS